MDLVQGIGGVFFRAKDPRAQARWYRDNLGIPISPGDGEQTGEETGMWTQQTGPTVWGPFPQDTEYFHNPAQQVMINFRVADLDAVLDRLRSSGTPVRNEIEEFDYGRFAWACDPEGNWFELWEPVEPDGGA